MQTYYLTDEENESEKEMYVMAKAMEFSDELKLTSIAFCVNRLFQLGIFLNPVNSEVGMVF